MILLQYTGCLIVRENMMKIKLLLFAGLRERVGNDEIEINLPNPPERIAVGSLIEFLPEECLGMNELIDCCRWAVNETFVSKETILHEGDEVALISPVAGG